MTDRSKGMLSALRSLPRVLADFGGRRRVFDRRMPRLPESEAERRSGDDRRSGFDRRKTHPESQISHEERRVDAPEKPDRPSE